MQSEFEKIRTRITPNVVTQWVLIKVNEKNRLVLVTTCHPRLKDLSTLIKRNLQHLYADQEIKKVFTSAPFVSFWSARNLKRILVRSKVYPLDKKVSSETCNGKWCSSPRILVKRIRLNPFRLNRNVK